ncbi:MAG: hypothetical protein L0Y66_15000, partial [Myxococcaceae bacterium]|nr:hypothetical protein [Myxococcaceae bacterium]
GRLARFWRDSVERHAYRVAKRNEPGRRSDYRYECKIEIKKYEEVLELLHRIIAPGVAVLCGVECEHVAGGASPEQLKRFLDSMDADLAKIEKLWSTASGSRVWEDLDIERDVVDGRIRELEALISGSKVEWRRGIREGLTCVLTRLIHSGNPAQDTFIVRWGPTETEHEQRFPTEGAAFAFMQERVEAEGGALDDPDDFLLGV